MCAGYQLPEPFQFNSLKHHLLFIKEFISHRIDLKSDNEIQRLRKDLKHIGTSVMDVYNGDLTVQEICSEVASLLEMKQLLEEDIFSAWTGTGFDDFRLLTLQDSSQWILKYHDDAKRYVHIFPARSSPHSLRVKANTLKSAILYYIVIGKDFISRNDLNRARAILGLSPVKNTLEADAITAMIEILRQ